MTRTAVDQQIDRMANKLRWMAKQGDAASVNAFDVLIDMKLKDNAGAAQAAIKATISRAKGGHD